MGTITRTRDSLSADIRRDRKQDVAGGFPIPLWLKVIPFMLLFLVASEEIFVSSVDDPFITYRYAHNLAQGLGPVFNVGERTEGFSSFLHLAIVAAYLKTFGTEQTVLLFAKLLGVVAGLVTVVLVVPLCKGLDSKQRFPWVAILLTASYLPFLETFVNGLETGLMTALVTLSCYLLIREDFGRHGVWSAMALVLVALTRPEGVMFALVAGAFVILSCGSLKRVIVQRWRWLVAASVPYILFLIWRYSYYGDFLPNTYYAKLRPFPDALTEGIGYLIMSVFLPYFWPLWLLAALGVGLWIWRSRSRFGPRELRVSSVSCWRRLLPGMFLAAQLFFVLKSGWDWIGSYRFVAPTMPLLFACLQMGLWAGADRLSRGKRQGWHLLSVIAVTVAVLGPVIGLVKDGRVDYRAWRTADFATSTEDILKNIPRRWLHRTVTDFVRREVASNAVVVYGEMGITPFFAPSVTFVDLHGLTDSTVARLPAKRTFTGIAALWFDRDSPLGAYVLSRNPDYVIDFVAGSPPEDVLDGNYRVKLVIPLDPTDWQWPGSTSLTVWERGR